MLVTKDFIKETSATSGTVAFQFSGLNPAGKTFSDVMADGDQCHYVASHTTLNEIETGLGTFNSGTNSLERTEIFESTNNDLIVNFSPGTKFIDLTLPSRRILEIIASINSLSSSVTSSFLSSSNSLSVTSASLAFSILNFSNLTNQTISNLSASLTASFISSSNSLTQVSSSFVSTISIFSASTVASFLSSSAAISSLGTSLTSLSSSTASRLSVLAFHNYYVEDFGAIGDGITDDTTAINAAIAAANLTSGCVHLLHKHLVTSALTPFSRDAVWIVGRGCRGDGTYIELSGSTPFNCFTVNGVKDCIIRDLFIEGPGTWASKGIGILILDAFRTIVERVEIQRTYGAIEIHGSVITEIIDSYAAAILGPHAFYAYGSELYGENHACRFRGCSTGTDITTGSITWYKQGSGAHTVELINCGALHGGRGLHVVDDTPYTGSSPRFTRALNFQCEDAEIHAVHLQEGATCSFTQLLILSSLGNAFQVDSTYSGNWEVNGGMIHGADGHGMSISGSHWSVTGLQIGNIDSGRDCINVSGSVQHFNIDNCSLGDIFGTSSVCDYGINLDIACDNFNIVGNRIIGNNIGTINNPAGVSTTRVVQGNTPTTTNTVRLDELEIITAGSLIGLRIDDSTGRPVALTPAEQGENLRFTTITTDTTSSGVFSTYPIAPNTTQIRCNTSTNVEVRGMTIPVVQGQRFIFNREPNSTGIWNFRHNTGGGTTQQQLFNSNESDIVLGEGQSIEYEYTNNRWRHIGGTTTTLSNYITPGTGIIVTSGSALSGTVTIGINNNTVATISGSRFTGTVTAASDFFAIGTAHFSGTATFATISGSMQQTAAGVSYLVGGDKITIASSSNGQITISASAADVSSSFVVIGTTGSLPNERALVEGQAITLTDGGAGSTISVGIQSVFSQSVVNVIQAVSNLSASITASFISASNSITITSQSINNSIVSGTTVVNNLRTPQFVTLASSTELPNERILTPGTGITLTDAGAGSTLTVGLDNDAVGSAIRFLNVLTDTTSSGVFPTYTLPATTTQVRCNTASDVRVNGISIPSEQGQRVIFHREPGSVGTWTFGHNGSGGVTQQQLFLSCEQDQNLAEGQSIEFEYSNNRWRHIGGTTCSVVFNTIFNSTLAATTNNLAIGNSTTVVRIDLTGNQSLTGMVAPTLGGKPIILINISVTDSLTLVHDSTSTAANRFLLPNGTNLVIPPMSMLLAYYDQTQSRWYTSLN